MSIIKILTIIVVMIFNTSCGMVKGHSSKSLDKTIKRINETIPQDSAVEEYIEDMIEDVTGIEIDFSPETVETKEV